MRWARGIKPASPQGGFVPGAAGLAYGLIQHGSAQKARQAAAFFQHAGGGGAGRTEIIVIHAAVAGVLLPQDDHRNF